MAPSQAPHPEIHPGRLPAPRGDSVVRDPSQPVLDPVEPGPGILVFWDATLLLGNGQRINSGTLAIEAGRIISVGTNIDVPEHAQIINIIYGWRRMS